MLVAFSSLLSLEDKETGKIKSHAMNLAKLKIKMLSDDYVQMYAGPIIQDTMQRWADGQLDTITAEREEIAAQEIICKTEVPPLIQRQFSCEMVE